MTEASDSELVRRYRNGEIGALDSLVRRHQKSLFGFVMNMVRDRSAAEDIFQETWLRALRGIDAYRDGNFGGWLVKIARNIIIDRSRKRQPELCLDTEDGEGRTRIENTPDPAPDPATSAEFSDVGRMVLDAVSKLPPDQREVFLMRVEAGLSFREIAKIQRVSINTALGRMHYALARLRPVLSAQASALTGSAQRGGQAS